MNMIFMPPATERMAAFLAPAPRGMIRDRTLNLTVALFINQEMSRPPLEDDRLKFLILPEFFSAYVYSYASDADEESILNLPVRHCCCMPDRTFCSMLKRVENVEECDARMPGCRHRSRHQNNLPLQQKKWLKFQ